MPKGLIATMLTGLQLVYYFQAIGMILYTESPL